jgi:glycosyltransferase involved in cell wall biosynthesis
LSKASRLSCFGSVLAALSSAAWLAVSIDWFRGIRRVPLLREARKRLEPLESYPSVSVVVPARDEGGNVEGAIRALLAQDYPGDLEVLAVDDRSTDGTGKVLSRLASGQPDTMRVIRVHELPDGWLGKNHALYLPGMDYRLSTALLASLALFVTNVLPFAGLFLARRLSTKLLFGVDVLLVLAMYLRGARRTGSRLSPLYAALHPFGICVFIYAVIRSAYTTLANGGIEWRGTKYPLDLLKENA